MSWLLGLLVFYYSTSKLFAMQKYNFYQKQWSIDADSDVDRDSDVDSKWCWTAIILNTTVYMFIYRCKCIVYTPLSFFADNRPTGLERSRSRLNTNTMGRWLQSVCACLPRASDQGVGAQWRQKYEWHRFVCVFQHGRILTSRTHTQTQILIFGP